MSTDRLLADSDPEFTLKKREPSQQFLFANEDLVIPESLRTFKKAITAIHAVPIKGEFSLNKRRLFDALIIAVQVDMKSRGRTDVQRIRDDRISPLFEIRITELARLAGIPGKNYVRIYEDLDELFEMVLVWNLLDEDSTIQWKAKAHFLSLLAVGHGRKRGLVQFSMDPEILGKVLEPKYWVTLSLGVMDSLKSEASYALYQNAFRYINTNNKVTAALPTETWIELLIGASRYVKTDEASGKKVVVDYNEWKRRFLLDAIDRVNAVKALHYKLVLKEIYAGKRVSKLQFSFERKVQDDFELPLNWTNDFLSVLTSIGFTEAELSDLSQSHSYEEVAETLVRLKAAEVRMKAQGRSMASPKAYFAAILQNITKSSASIDAEIDQVSAEAERLAEQELATRRLERQTEGFKAHRTAVANRRIFELPSEQQKTLFVEFEASPAAKQNAIFLQKGWVQKNVPLLAVFRDWLATTHPEAFGSLLPNPEDKSLEAWMAWKLDQAMDTKS